jgi:hypothetical protein
MVHRVIDVIYGPGKVTLDDSAFYGMSFVAGSAATGFVVWLCKTGGTRNELRNLSESISTLRSDISNIRAELRAQQDRQQATNDNLYNLQLVSVGTAAIEIGTAATATVIGVFKGRG